jgi:hypothetical protein
MVLRVPANSRLDPTFGFAWRGQSLEVGPQRRSCDGETTQAKYSPKAASAIG